MAGVARRRACCNIASNRSSTSRPSPSPSSLGYCSSLLSPSSTKQSLLRPWPLSPPCYSTRPLPPPAPFHVVSPKEPLDPSILPDLSPATPPRLRFAPSPTGALHLGGLRTALFNYLFAKRFGGQWILRVEDTDQARLVPGSLESMQEMLQWAGLQWDEGPGISSGTKGPYIQSQRLELYRHHAEELIRRGVAYRDFRVKSQGSVDEDAKIAMQYEANGDLRRRANEKQAYASKAAMIKQRAAMQKYVPPTEDEAQRMIRQGKGYCVRLKMEETDTRLHDGVFDRLLFKPDVLAQDPVLMKTDGWPTYHLASVIDDHLMGITHVLRGEEWLPSIPKHIALYKAFGFKQPTFLHLPLLMNKDRTKLSKKTKDVDIAVWRDEGYEPEAVLNYISLMGYNHHGVEQSERPVGEGSAKEVLTLQEMIDTFEPQRISRHRAVPFPPKLEWLNRRHILLKSSDRDSCRLLVQRILPSLQERFPEAVSAGLMTEDYVCLIVEAVAGRVGLLKDFSWNAQYFFQDPDYWFLASGPKVLEPSDPAAGGNDVVRRKRKGLHLLLNHPRFTHFAQRARATLESLDERQWKDKETLESTLTALADDLATEQTQRGPESTPGNDRVGLWQVLRFALFGGRPGPDFASLLYLLGPQRSLHRLQNIVDFQEEWAARQAHEGPPEQQQQQEEEEGRDGNAKGW